MTSVPVDYARILWQIAAAAPVGLALLAAGFSCWRGGGSPRGRVPWPGVTFLVLVLFHAGM
jgi:hypothetical protein